MKEHYLQVIKDSDARVGRSLEIQEMDKECPEYGGFFGQNGYAEPKVTIYRLTTMTACYMNEESKWYNNEEIYKRICLALEYTKRVQRKEGFFDLPSCNFYSGPDTAFCVKRLFPYYVYLKRVCEKESGEKADRYYQIKELIEEILKKAAAALTHCGFHTPNHRWAIASALMMCWKYFGQEIYKQKADEILLEGCDCNEEGEYAERSAGNYNRVNNDAMIMLAAATGDKKYYDPVIRNLKMMLTYVDPDDSIFTNHSTRQDRGKKVYLKDYYFEYLYMGYKTENEMFLGAANYIMDTVKRHGLTTMDCLIHFMMNPELIGLECCESGIETDYHRFYQGSEIVRRRKGEYSYTILNQCPSFLYFQSGDFAMNLKIGAGFCEHRNFISKTLEKTERGYHLHETMKGWYYLPFQTPPATSDWWKMGNENRKKLYGPDMIFDVMIEEVEEGIDVRIVNTGVDRAPLRVEMIFDCGCRVETEAFSIEGKGRSSIVAKSGTVTASKGRYAIEAGPCFGAHRFTSGMRGSENAGESCFTVYCTDFSCFDRTIHLRAKKSSC
ncbi:MAG TPA: hypothetical protein H9740_11205 [Candidatus Hungatella pullicola]|nr:hypothetical protein [Candidatus Hungatella pullicola]